jgi:hypothetical protein
VENSAGGGDGLVHTSVLPKLVVGKPNSLFIPSVTISWLGIDFSCIYSLSSFLFNFLNSSEKVLRIPCILWLNAFDISGYKVGEMWSFL